MHQKLSFALLFGLTTVLFGTGCNDSEVGLFCQLPAQEKDKGNSLITTQSNDCKGKICINHNPQNENSLGTCTERCDNDSDCPDPDEFSAQGYKCVISTVSGNLACQRFCVPADRAESDIDPKAAQCINK